jgi:DtxR family transcriptional regulator, Mn-dependent transcriptional regulator
MSPDIVALERGSSLQRDGLNHQAIEDYLKTIYMLLEQEGKVSMTRIADTRQVKPGSATSMLQRLARLGLVDYQKNRRSVTLTEAGREIALEVVRHHRLIELYLVEKLGFSWDEVHVEADLLEHVISEKLEERIAAALNYPKVDPHGDPIPSKEGELIKPDSVSLASLPAGTQATVARVPDDANSEMLRYLGSLGLVPGARLGVKEVAPFEGPLTLFIGGQEKIVGHKVASAVQVQIVEV